jgi:hypothetical protein
MADKDADILDDARERLNLSMASEGDNRQQALIDLKFGYGDQWESRTKQDRENDFRPCLTINITDAMVRRVTNACRENRPRIKVHAVSDGADKQTAETIDGLIRHIEYSSSADVAYDCAVESAIRMGWGYIRVRADYVDERSFDQEIKIERIRNPFTVYPDPASTTSDFCDGEWCLISEEMTKEEYKARFGDKDPESWNLAGIGDSVQGWSSKDMVRVAEYFCIEKRPDTLYQLSDGSLRLRRELPSKEGLSTAGLMVVGTRPTVVKQICWYLLNGTKVLDRRELPGKYIPIVPVYGREMDVDGKVQRKGMIRDLRDPARMYNFAQTAKTEVYALQPRAPWLIAEGQMEGHEIAWQNANRKPTVALPYKPILGPDGQPTPPPMRQEPPAVAAGFAEWAQSSQSDFLAVAGMPNDPGQDAKGEVVSGIAIKRRTGMADISHYDFYDNLTRSLRHVGRIVVDWLPIYYDTPRMARIIREDGTPESIQLNQPVLDHIKNDMTVGKYEVVVDTGPSYQTKREESAEAQMELLGTPLGQMVAGVAGDLVVRSLDFPNSAMIADRLEAQIPAAMNDPQSDLPPKAQAMIAGLQQKLQQQGQQMQAMQVELKLKGHIAAMQEQGKTDREKMWVEADARRNREDNQTTLTKTEQDNEAKRDVAEINAATQLLNTHAEAAHERRAARELIERGTKEAEK